MTEMVKEYFKNIRACAHCGSMFSEVNLLCKTCWSYADREQNSVPNFRQWDYEFTVFSLYTWLEQAHLHSLVYGLKGGGLHEAFERLASRFLAQRNLLSNEEYKSAVIIPAPASVPGSRDHAFEWAAQLEKLSGASLLCPLSRIGHAPQKQLDKRARLEKKMSASNDLDLSRFTKVIFVDDVITSGGTAGAAFVALGRPKQFEVWTISCRPSKLLL